ncbi:hypothetical protein KJ909_04010 [Patescibacteria group bacterium]|nr:hypothetical protein [Patescibacteria group bacterium]
MSEERKHLPYVRKALAAASTVDQLLAARADLEQFQAVWEFVADKLRTAIPVDGTGMPGPVSPQHAITVLEDIQGVIDTINKDLEKSRERGLVVHHPPEPSTGVAAPAPPDPMPPAGQSAPPSSLPQEQVPLPFPDPVGTKEE